MNASSPAMTVAVTTAAETIEFRKVERPGLVPGHVVVRVDAVTLCGTDLHIWEDDYPTELPIIQGHEIAGTVVESGDAQWQDARVVIDPLVNCGVCSLCLRGRSNICQKMSVLGCYEDGAFSEYLLVPVEKLHRIPESLSTETAALAEPGSISMQAVYRGTPVAGERALVLGCGPIGLFAILRLKELGLHITAVDTDAARLVTAEEFGAAQTFLVDANFPTAEQRELLIDPSTGLGPTLVIEATGAPASIKNAVELVEGSGRIVQVGISAQNVELPIKAIPFKELDIRGSRNSGGHIPESLGLLERNSELVATLISHRFDLADLTKAFHTMRDRSQRVGKILIRVPGETPFVEGVSR